MKGFTQELTEKGYTITTLPGVHERRKVALDLVKAEYIRLRSNIPLDDNNAYIQKYSNFVARDQYAQRVDFCLDYAGTEHIKALYAPVLASVKTELAKILSDDMKCIVRIIVAHPQADHQEWHRDIKRHKNGPESFNVFVPLIDVGSDIGLTEMIPESHNFKRGTEQKAVTAVPIKDQVLIFNYSILHRGLPNRSMEDPRFVIAFVFSKREFVDINYSQKRPLLSNEARPTRDQRAKRRRKL